MSYTPIKFQIGKSKKAKWYQGGLPAKLIKPIQRYTCGMTVGAGWYVRKDTINQIGATCQVIGYFDDGRLNMLMPVGGNGILGLEDVELTGEIPERVNPEHLTIIRSLPRLSFVSERGNLILHGREQQEESKKLGRASGYSPECTDGAHTSCGGCDNCDCHAELLGYDPDQLQEFRDDAEIWGEERDDDIAEYMSRSDADEGL